MRHLAVIRRAVCALGILVAAGALTAAAPRRLAPNGLPLAPAWSREYLGAAPEAAAVAMTFSLQHKVGMVMGAASCDKRRSNLRRNGWMLVWLLC